MLKYISIFLVITGCTTDVSISKTYKTEHSDTSSAIDSSSATKVEETGIEDITDTDTSTQQDLSKTIGYVEMGLMQASCPYCMGLPQEINTIAYARFHSPTTGAHAGWLPQEDGCRDYYESNVSASNKDVGQIVTLQNTFGDNITLSKTSDNSGVVYENSYIQDASYRRNTFHTLNAQGKTAENAIETLRGFDYIEPYTMLYVDPSYAFQAPINRSGSNNFSWGPSGDQSGFFTIHVSVYSYDGSAYYGTVICRSEDNGFMTIPGSYFQQYQPGNITSIHMMRHKTKKQEYEEFEGTIESHSWWEVIGTGYIQ